MEKKNHKVGYYFLSLVPMVGALMIQVVVAVVWSIVGTAIYSSKLVMEQGPEALNDMAAVQEGAVNYYLSNILYVVIAAQIGMLIFAGIWYGILIKKQCTNRAIKEAANLRTIGMCVLFGIGLQFVIGFLLQICAVIFPDTIEAYSELMQMAGIGETTALSLFATVVIAPISEELLFRGLTLRFLQKAGAKFWIANTIQALLFGILHLNLVQGLYAFVLGLVLGYVAGKCKSVFLSVMVHLTFNLLGQLLAFILGDFESWAVWGVLFVLGAVAIVGAAFLLKKELDANRESTLLTQEG